MKEKNNESPSTRVNADKKCVFVILLLISLVEATFEIPILDRKSEIGTVRRFALLKSRCPNPENNTSCTLKDRVFRIKTKYCKYNCQSWEDIKCMNYGNMSLYVCIPGNTSCPRGIGWQIERVEPAVDGVGEGSVFIMEDFCVEGKYQPGSSKCFDACRKWHIPQSHIPEGFMIYKKGDHIHPALLMCNATAGFYNPHNRSYIYLDGSFSQDFCIHISVSNPCSSGQIPIHNGTCVNKCDPGFSRNEMDFTCEEIIGIPNSLPKNSTEVPPVTVAEKSTTPETKRITDIPVKTESEKDIVSYILIGLIIIAVAFGVLVGRFMCRHNNQGNSKTISGRKVHVGGEFSKISTTGDIHVNIGEGSANKLKLIKQSSTDTGFSMPGTEIESDEESGGRYSLESGYDTVQHWQQVPGQDPQAMMMEMKSMNTESRPTENCEETKVLKLWTKLDERLADR